MFGLFKKREPGAMELEWNEFANGKSNGSLMVKEWQEIEDVLSRLVDELRDHSDAYVILRQTPQSYMQMCVLKDGFQIEYQDGDTERHYKTTEPPNLERAKELFAAYWKSPETIGEMDRWEQMSI
jgi:hypothetical protein